MTTIVTITATAKAVVISERIGDRERHENGRDELVPYQAQSFIVHQGQSLRVVELEEEAAPVPAEAPAAEGEGA